MKKPRYQKIKYDKNNNPYVTHYGKKLNLNDFQADAEGNLFYCPTYFSAYVVEIAPDGEFAKVIFENVA